ncbi:MAG: hypothetical protein Q8O76_03680 [Chloroflexota bacterium]|nr:hypothetical protein [Chloroflexota bacterium]
MPNPKNMLKAGLSLPRKVEATLPAGAPSISKVLEAGVNALPDLPMPVLPSLPGTAGAKPQVREFIRSVESNLPAGFPSLDRAARAADGVMGSKIRIGPEGAVQSTTAPIFKIGA